METAKDSEIQRQMRKGGKTDPRLVRSCRKNSRWNSKGKSKKVT